MINKTNSLISKISTSLLGLSIFLTVRVPFIDAQVTNPAIKPEFGGHPDTVANPTAFQDRFGTLFVYFWNLLITVGTLLFFGMFLLGAIEWISAGGDKSKIEKARERITQSVIGLFILVLSFVILSIINYFVFGSTFDIFELYFPTPGVTP